MIKLFTEFHTKILRKRANVILKKFPIFYLSAHEYIKHCLIFEQNFAGIVLGYCFPEINIKIVSIKSGMDLSKEKPLSLGYFGEIVYHLPNEKWNRTNLCGFVDQRNRVWCCGPLDNIIQHDDDDFFPYCIEPVFENLIFVKSAKLTPSEKGYPILKIQIRAPFRFRYLKKFLLRNLYSFAERFEKTKHLHEIILVK